MNYYEHHIGDYAEATLHLSFVEDAAYSRLIRKYYATEKPLPVDLKTVQRLIGARSKEEKAAVELVLQEFFVQTDEGWRNKRCDEVIAAYRAGEPEREVKKANEENRMRRYRDERSRLFRAITEAGLHAPWNIGMGELREMAARVTALPMTAAALVPVLSATPQVMSPATLSATSPATSPATSFATAETAAVTPVSVTGVTAAVMPATVNQTPDTNIQSPMPNHHTHNQVPLLSSQAAAVCVALRAEGMASVNPQHPDLLALLGVGVALHEFVQAARIARERGKGFAYVIGVVKGQRAAQERATQEVGKLHKATVARHARHDVEEPV